jgi:hypothetical protein
MTRLIEDGIVVGADGDNPDLEDAFAKFGEELKSDTDASGYIKVHKLPLDERGNPRGNSGRQIYLFEAPMGEITVSDVINRVLRDYFLPGENHVTIRVTGHGGGRPGVRFQRIISLQRPPVRETPNQGPSMSTEIANLMRVMQESQRASDERAERNMQQMMQLMLQQRTAPASVAGDPVAMMGQVGQMMAIFQTMFSGMKPAIAGETVNPMKSMVENLQLMKQVQTLMGGNAPADDTSFAGVLKALAPIAGPALQMIATAQANQSQAQARKFKRRPPAQIAPPVQEIPVSDTPVTDPPTQENPEMLAKAKQLIGELCDMATQGADPTQAAELALDMLPEDMEDSIGELVSDPNKFAFKIALLDARTKNHAEWFETFRAKLAEEFQPEADE